ncbi:putative transcriptional regulator [Treponema primitia ZAS-2]|uniref:Putative transcriptional regulator n=1 Tax=Treponema primitia (strain ATCC BAA-887 / DSM 12427 / ZAS-2) TaxID=545694 RepID=F5YJJ9_TREPZ|nr:helix-turn-helix domain-containing protein [Treponema primitia]AEF84873.1 putative transcriptional regulator [Treponema primitia ZAS-2]
MNTDASVFDNFEAGKALIHSLEQAIAFERGDKTKARVSVREIPTPKYEAGDVIQIRQRYQLTQRALALALNVSPRTVEAWEAGKNKPSGSSSKLLYLLERDTTIINQLVSR